MRPRTSLIARSLLGAAFLSPLAAHATNGYFAHGYGMKNKGMAGAAVSQAQDAFGGANNPASMVWAGSRVDMGVDWFSPQRKASRTGSMGGAFDFEDKSSRSDFAIPEFGYNAMVSDSLSLGVTVYGNGGMNTDYSGGVASCGFPGRPANGLCGRRGLGVDLMQLIIAPTVAWKFHPSHSVGIAPLFGYQRFKAKGLQAFDNAPGFPPFTGSTGDVTNRGNENSTGWGVRVGYMGKIGDMVTVGASYASKMRMSDLDKYKGLFAEGGGFDIPEHYAVGVTLQPVAALQVSADYEKIKYSGIRSVHNPSSNQAPLGASNGPGFGWQDVDVFKLGVQWKFDDRLTLRAGYNHGDNPIRSQDVSFNILAPGVVKNHYTLGFTYTLTGGSEITMAYMHAARESVSGASFLNSPALLGPGNGGREKIEMYENSLGIAWGTRF
ncbi:MAG: long-chain fatty acid transporter [Thermomicrobiales bacterium]|jgi:long-chain fatty acid transport protein|nr:MAG: long-chain fatty acid transporter [Thermomicrobiales bacterium]